MCFWSTDQIRNRKLQAVGGAMTQTAITSERFLTAYYLKEDTEVKSGKELLLPSTIMDPYSVHIEIIVLLGNRLKNIQHTFK